MNETELQSAWSDVYSSVALAHPETDRAMINAFFTNLEPQVMSEEGYLLLTAKNDFIKAWIEQSFLQDIKNALRSLYGKDFVVQLEINTAQNNTIFLPLSGESTAISSTPQEPVSQPILQQAVKPNNLSQQPTPQTEVTIMPQIGTTQRFENFVIGDENRMAYQYALQVASEPGRPNLNPLFIYGGSGFGKTHLLHAIKNEIITTPELQSYNVVYVDTNEFVNNFTSASLEHSKDKNSFLNFSAKYKNADVLILDDVQYLERKTGTIDMVFQIFNELHAKGKQIIMAADRSPKIIDIDERCQSRFMSGLTIDIRVPSIETKLGIIKQFIEEYKKENHPEFYIPEDAQEAIADMSSSNIRELKGAMNRIIAFYETEKRESYETLTKFDVEELLKDYFTGGKSKHLSIADIQREVEKYYGISHSDLIGSKRNQPISSARQVAIYLCSFLLNTTQQTLGEAFKRDHTTIIHSLKVIETKMRETREFNEEIQQLINIIKAL